MARMLSLAAHPLGLPVLILAGKSDEPAAQVATTQTGSLESDDDLKSFLSKVDVITFESEFVDVNRLRSVLPDHVKVFPSLENIETIQDRLTQKKLLDRFKIPSSPWLPVDGKEDLRRAREKFPEGFVLKQRRFGYDGYGTFVFKKGQGDESALNKTQHGFIAESFIDFRRELALSLVRSKNGVTISLPLVESVQKNSRCFSVMGPVAHKKATDLVKKLKRMMNEIDYVGILAFELFDGRSGLLVNELAPRVHNSAHYSQDALSCSQFEYHLRAGLDWPLPKIELMRPGFAMINLLGEGGDIRLSRKPLGHLHWYGKAENRPGRKLGHINVLAGRPKEALKKAQLWRKDFKL